MRLRLPFFLFLLAGMVIACTREYSFEGNNRTDRPIPTNGDTSAKKDTTFSGDTCTGCTGAFEAERWSLRMNGALFCGTIDTAIVSAGRDAFTFFGPSLCSAAFGLIITVRLDEKGLVEDKNNLQLYKSSLNYYDNTGGNYVVQSRQGMPFSVVLLRYDRATKKAEGSFSGTVFTKAGNSVNITDGRWKTHLR